MTTSLKDSFLANIINATGDPLFVKDKDSKFVLANGALCTMLGLALKDIIGKTLAENLPKEQMGHFLRIDREVLETGLENLCEEQLTGYDGIRIIVTKKTRYIDENGDRFLVGVIHDITEKRALETKLRQSEKLESIGRLAGGIAHDFNNILGAIVGFTDLSLSKVEKGSALENYLQQIEKASERATTLVRQILTFSRQKKPEKTFTDLRLLVTEVENLLRAAIPSRIAIETHMPNDPCLVLADTSQVHEALLNLGTNARDAIIDKGQIIISVYKKDEYVVVEFSDTGSGMSAETKKKMFEPYFTTKEFGKGSGLGLPIVKGVLDAHGGYVKVESEKGVGSKFRLFFPSAKGDTADVREHVLDGQIYGSGAILFVDDEKNITDMASESLSSLGYIVTCCADGEDALEIIKNRGHEFDILITDQMMPNMTGLELIQEVKKIRPNLPIILCTGFSAEIDARKADLMGVGFLPKPYRRHPLGMMLKNILQRKI